MLASGGSSNGERPLPSIGEWTAVASANRGVLGTWSADCVELVEDSDAVRPLSWSGVGLLAVRVCISILRR